MTMDYPIKYAVLELKKEGGLIVGYKDITQGFIVSKCYVMESNILYRLNRITHKVVFPFADISKFQDSIKNSNQNIGEKNIPCYDASGNISPVWVVKDLFDSYEEAKIVAEGANKEYRCNLAVEVDIESKDWNWKLKKIRQEFDKNLKLCYLFEKLVQEATEDMNVSELLTNEQESLVKILKIR